MAWGWIIAAGGGVLAIGALRARAAEQRAREATPPSPTPPPDSIQGLPCEALRAMSEAAYWACRGTQILDSAIDAVTETVADIEEENIAVNGPVVNRNPFDAAPSFWAARQAAGWRNIDASTRGGNQSETDVGLIAPPPQHENGCIPAGGAYVSDAVGWHRCGPGTRNYVGGYSQGRGPLRSTPETGERAWRRVGRGEWGLGPPDWPWEQGRDQRRAMLDPMTHPHWSAVGSASFGGGEMRDLPYPLEVPEGQVPWWIVGRPVLCPAGTVPMVVRSGGRIVERTCVLPPSSLPPPPAGGSATGGEIDEAAFVWVPDGAGGGYWARRPAT